MKTHFDHGGFPGFCFKVKPIFHFLFQLYYDDFASSLGLSLFRVLGRQCRKSRLSALSCITRLEDQINLKQNNGNFILQVLRLRWRTHGKNDVDFITNDMQKAEGVLESVLI